MDQFVFPAMVQNRLRPSNHDVAECHGRRATDDGHVAEQSWQKATVEFQDSTDTLDAATRCQG